MNVWPGFGAIIVGVALLLVACNGSDPIEPPAGLVSWWPGDDNANDIADGNHGALTGGATFAEGRVGQAFSLDGVDDFVLAPASANLNITGDVTVDLWAKRTAFGEGVMVAKGDVGPLGTPGKSAVFLLHFGPDDTLRGGYWTASGGSFGVVGPPVTDSDFHHYAYVRSGATSTLYLDGAVVSNSTLSEGPGDTTEDPMTIGTVKTELVPSGFASHFSGIIDEVQVFNRALSEIEIGAIFDAGSAGKVKETNITTQVRLVFTSQIDPATVEPADFVVNQTQPLSATVQQDEILLVVGEYTYFPMPEVQVVGVVLDTSGQDATILSIHVVP